MVPIALQIVNVLLWAILVAGISATGHPMIGIPGWVWSIFQLYVGIAVAHRLWKTRHA